MILPDVNVLVYAYRADATDHSAYRRWLEDVANSEEAFALADLVLSRFVRVATHPRILRPSSPIDDALGFAEDLEIHRDLEIALEDEGGDHSGARTLPPVPQG